MTQSGVYYEVKTSLPPEQIGQIAGEIYKMWLQFALGERTLGGRSLAHPTGKYAASIKLVKESAYAYSILADEEIAPEGGIIEKGHGRFDLKTKFKPGWYPMHRGSYGQPKGLGPQMWAEAREYQDTGGAFLSVNARPDSWWLPAMRAYSPARHLAQLAKTMALQAS
jgi:hypothetical protein